LDIRRKQKAVVDALEDIKAADITVFNVSHLSSLFDRVIIASADSARQTKALARSVQDKMVEIGERVVGIEGEDTGEWVLVDTGDVIVHIMQPAIRVHYNLEELWDQPAPRKRRAGSASTDQHASP
jgi:ribosome-associated protein